MPATANNGLLFTPEPKPAKGPRPDLTLKDPDTRIYIGDCRDLLARIPECAAGQVDLVFADPPFNWNRDYDRWKAQHQGGTRAQFEAEYQTWADDLPREDYLDFTYDWIDGCIKALKPDGSLFINIPDDTAAEIVCFLKGHLQRQPAQVMHMVNWCIWHYRFGQNRSGAFINSKVHVLYFAKDPDRRTWRPERILEPSDRATTYFDPRTQSKKDGMPPGQRVPMDVWYGAFMGRIQGNNAERRANHDNQIPEAYLNRVIQCASDEGMLVLDPFLGSGTTGVVARALKRRFIGCEFSKANAKSAFERIETKGLARPLDTYKSISSAIFAPRKRKGDADA